MCWIMSPVPDTLSEYLQKFVTEQRLDRFREVLAQRTRYLTMVLEDIFHPHNASACLRTCDCFGIQDVHIVEHRNEFEPNEEISLGSSQWLTIHQHLSDSGDAGVRCIQQLQEQGFRVVATSPRQNSLPLDQVPIDKPLAVIFGAEQMGVSEASIEASDALVHIPMYGFTESFNISVSLALIARELTTRIRAAGIEWQLPADQHDALLDEWVEITLGEKLAPLKRRHESDREKSNE